MQGRREAARRPARFGEKRPGAGVSGPRAAGKDRKAAKLDSRSRRRSAVAAEMLPAPPPPRPPPPPRGKRTRAAGREESEAVPGTPGGTRGRREGRERSESVGPTDRLRRSPGGSERGSERGRYRRPPTEAHRAALGPREPSPGRSSGAGLGWGGAGTVAPPPQLPAGTSGPARAGPSRAWEDFPARRGGCTWRSLPGPAPNAPAFGEPALGLWDCCPIRGSRSRAVRPKAEFSQLPRVFLCLPAGAWQLFQLNGKLS